MSGIRIQEISKTFGDQTALSHVDLEVFEGEFFSLLGPSGCGKTTLLNMIAGFLEPTTGGIFIGGREVTGLPPYRREIGMVFQDYALFPHLSVSDNVAYGLRIRKVPRKEVQERVRESLALVQLEAYASRMPHQLSGGQRQRVAIARALAIRPAVLLLDEPLSNLDAKLRKDMQTELRNIQRRTGITTILVTHDQEEALSLSDRIGILGDGRLQQLGTPLDVYRRPSNRFVAEFIGQVNLIAAAPEAASAAGGSSPAEAPLGAAGTAPYAAPAVREGGANLAAFAAAQLQAAPGEPLRLLADLAAPEGGAAAFSGAPASAPAAASASPAAPGSAAISASAPGAVSPQSGETLFMLRPERIRVAAAGEGAGVNRTPAAVSGVSYAGNVLRIRFELAGSGSLTVHASDPDFPALPEPGQVYDLYWRPQDLIPVLPGEGPL
ncbi:ABC transporter ATP-binding protein [Saccharibacillus sp. CPCC 101409]|uniref:ABC transporter ATP-binding protein n=1 Tax=Saccharibacillus sp. CPCC 101409 TaxID=3058041 RepID=UPI002673D381|nr:ABC transporter ATP-binding protein [Saccharibacillus sp. CPCC 101409]MDO3408205.1 ABC transporter ATP-binding protein [Saccharibacillus sp. CPCC 101409]